MPWPPWHLDLVDWATAAGELRPRRHSSGWARIPWPILGTAIAVHRGDASDRAAWVGSNEALVAWPLAMAVSGLYALVVGLISLRTSGVYFIMITLAFAQMVVLTSSSRLRGLRRRRRTAAVAAQHRCRRSSSATPWRFVPARLGLLLAGLRPCCIRMVRLALRPWSSAGLPAKRAPHAGPGLPAAALQAHRLRPLRRHHRPGRRTDRQPPGVRESRR
ncbi:MAG: hypothetical protein U5L11_12815 [Arhodomonas sp.]|nr:hypothetical protein [Arhodomonas sp.]